MYYIFVYYHYLIFYLNSRFGSICYHFFIYYKWCFAFINIYSIYYIITGELLDENFNLLKKKM